jgi:hypothetical protein
MSPSRRRSFEGLVIAVLVLEWIQGTVQYPASLAAHGVVIAAGDAFVAPIASFALALAISRLGSRVAALLFLLLLALAVASTIGDALTGWLTDPAFLIGSAAVALDLVATALVLRLPISFWKGRARTPVSVETQ